ncbi:MAG: hypothetical protein CL947_00620 [Epsilonproteobacteria bacterium]|nr:hypothetical protein [Campylobacterota bacterium]|tara:strand:- start:4663 stop:4908 length:246 start_codon:yes stop_codon:yes gene_type:complete
MKLSIIDTEKTTTHTVNWVELNTPVGNMVIQEKHAPIVVELAPQQELLFELKNGEKQSITIVQGVAHVTREEVKILLPLAL